MLSCYFTVVMEVLPVPSTTGLLQKEQEEINKVNPSLKTGRRVRSLRCKVNFYTSVHYILS